MPPGNKLFAWGKLWVRSNKDSLEWRSSREPPSSSNNDSSLRMRLWRRSSPILPLHKAMRLRVFTVVTGFWFSRLSWSLEEVKMGIGQIKMPHNSLFLLRFNLFFFFFLHKLSLHCCKLLVNFQSFKKSWSWQLCQCSHCLWKSRFLEILIPPFLLMSLLQLF